MSEVALAVGATALVLAALLVAWFWMAGSDDVLRARRVLRQKRGSLDQELFRRAAASGLPRGLRWKRLGLEPDATLARDRETGQILAFVAVTVSFEAIAGGPMEGVEAVDNLRAGTAVFTYERGTWTTDGRVLFNLDPQDAMRRYEGRIEQLNVA
jgi:hypothetical protein